MMHPLATLPLSKVLPGGIGTLLSKCCCLRKLGEKQAYKRELQRKERKNAYQRLVREIMS